MISDLLEKITTISSCTDEEFKKKYQTDTWLTKTWGVDNSMLYISTSFNSAVSDKPALYCNLYYHDYYDTVNRYYDIYILHTGDIIIDPDGSDRICLHIDMTESELFQHSLLHDTGIIDFKVLLELKSIQEKCMKIHWGERIHELY